MFFGWKFKANAYLFRDLLTKRHILLQLAIQVSDALVCVAESETNQVFWCVLLPQPSRAEPPKCVSTRFRLPQLLEKLMQGTLKLVGGRLGVCSPVELRTLTLLRHLSNLFTSGCFALDKKNKKI